MRLALHPHPDWRAAAIDAVAVDLAWAPDGRLALTYVVSGQIEALRIPAPAPPARADDLWRHTCFEVFAQAPGDTAYREFNFSPSTQWAAYRFDAYRSGMAPADVAAPTIAVAQDKRRLEVAVLLDLARNRPWRLALTAVLEDGAGWKSYWALRHPPGKPDFHHADGFAFDHYSESA